MKKTLLIASLLLSLLTIVSCNNTDDSTGNGAHMPATDNNPGNTTSDNSSNNNVNTHLEGDNKAGHTRSTGGNIDVISDSLKPASPHHPQ